MSTPAVTTPVVIDETAISAETERLIRVAAERNNLPVDAIREQVREEALAQARKNLEQAAADEGNPYKEMYEQERKQREIAEGKLQSVRTQGQKSSTSAGGPPVSAAQAKARAGDHQWNHKMTDAQKIAALGVPPDSVSVKEAQKFFGRGADTKTANDLMKADPARYRTLKQVALAVGVYGN
jgi:hypothetical protein